MKDYYLWGNSITLYCAVERNCSAATKKHSSFIYKRHQDRKSFHIKKSIVKSRIEQLTFLKKWITFSGSIELVSEISTTISIRIISDDYCENDNCNSDNCKNRRFFCIRRLFKVQDDAAKLHEWRSPP